MIFLESHLHRRISVQNLRIYASSTTSALDSQTFHFTTSFSEFYSDEREFNKLPPSFT
jgi:hypothetical protein